MTEHFDKSVRRTAYSFIVFMLVIMMALISMSAMAYNSTRELKSQSEDLQNILTIVDRELVSSWNISSKYGEYTIGEGLGIVLEGDFVCTPEALEVDPFIQFEATLRPVDPAINPFVNIPKGTPVEAKQACTNSTVEFTIPWDSLGTGILNITKEAQYHVGYHASTESGWKSATTTTNDFIIINPAQ